MSHFAKVKNQKVLQVIVAEQEFIDSLPTETGVEWIQTSYNTRGGVHLLGGKPLRKNYAAVGYTYDATRDAFIPPKPFPSWTLNDDSCLWEAPVAYPDDDKFYTWDEAAGGWQEVDD